jgi:hypothetical protein
VNGILAYRWVPRRLSESQDELVGMMLDAGRAIDRGISPAAATDTLANIYGQARATIDGYEQRQPLGPNTHRLIQPPQWLIAVEALTGALLRSCKRRLWR